MKQLSQDEIKLLLPETARLRDDLIAQGFNVELNAQRGDDAAIIAEMLVDGQMQVSQEEARAMWLEAAKDFPEITVSIRKVKPLGDLWMSVLGEDEDQS